MSERPIIAARGVTRRFGGLLALDSIDLDIPHGIVQAIIGPNGSGKTTLLNALSGASHADAGSIRIDGTEVSRIGSRGLDWRAPSRPSGFSPISAYSKMSRLRRPATGRVRCLTS